MTAHSQIMDWGERLEVGAAEFDPDVEVTVLDEIKVYWTRYSWGDLGDMFKQTCELHHEWYAPMYFELGGWFYCNEDVGPYCPRCGKEAES